MGVDSNREGGGTKFVRTKYDVFCGLTQTCSRFSQVSENYIVTGNPNVLIVSSKYFVQNC